MSDAPELMFWSEKGTPCLDYERSSGTIKLVTLHGHKATFCIGLLSISASRVAFQSFEAKYEKDPFDAPRSELRRLEMKGLLFRTMTAETSTRLCNLGGTRVPALNKV
jgi:hypothetical protein